MLAEKIVSLAENLRPLALIGPGGIGKTSISLNVLHYDRIKQRFGDNRRFIRYDQFSSSCAHLPNHISEAIGVGVENPKSLTSLRQFLSQRETPIVLDPWGVGAEKIYPVLEELSQLDNVCLCITSRISTVPPDCETLEIPTLSIDAARDTFYRTYKNAGQPELVDDILDELDFHSLFITLFATVGHQNK